MTWTSTTSQEACGKRDTTTIGATACPNACGTPKLSTRHSASLEDSMLGRVAAEHSFARGDRLHRRLRLKGAGWCLKACIMSSWKRMQSDPERTYNFEYNLI